MGTCACIPASFSTAASTGSAARSSSIWRLSSARFSARSVKIRSAIRAKLLRVADQIGPAIDEIVADSLHPKLAEDGRDVGAVLDAVIDHLNPQGHGWMRRATRFTLFVKDIVWCGAFRRPNQRLADLAGKGAHLGERGLILPLKGRLGTLPYEQGNIVAIRPDDVLQRLADRAIRAGGACRELFLAEARAHVEHLQIGPLVVTQKLDRD